MRSLSRHYSTVDSRRTNGQNSRAAGKDRRGRKETWGDVSIEK